MAHLKNRSRSTQTGGITILVVFSLLVLMTVVAVGMSRNSLREVFIVGSSRQSAIVRQTADSGLEFAILWADVEKTPPTNPGGIALQNTYTHLLSGTDLQGISTPVTASGATDMQLPAPAGQSRSFSLKVLRLGPIDPDNSQTLDDRLKNVLWVVQSSGRSTVGTTTFQHDRELWMSTTARTK